MDDTSAHSLLITDQCDQCRYVEHAFTLLKLPLIIQTYQAFNEQSPQLKKHTTVILCPHAEAEHIDEIINITTQYSCKLVSFQRGNSKKDEQQRSAIYLNPHFSVAELQSCLIATQPCTECGHNIDHAPIFEKLVGPSKQIRHVKTLIHQVANTDSTVLILGKSGTGKDVLASCIHQLSDRHTQPFVPINCGAIPAELLESELFGHEKGAFTGALARRQGRFEIANGGTIFLDEIGDMPMTMQVKLLRILQEQKFERVGGNVSITTNVRIIAATNKNLDELIRQNLFREDLFYRLNVFPIYVPNLHERMEDIPYMIEYHLDKIQQRLKHRVNFTPAALKILCDYPWPGNVRELENFLERMVILYKDHVVDIEQLDQQHKQFHTTQPALPRKLSDTDTLNMKEYLLEVEKTIIQNALEQTGGMIHAAAKYLSIGKSTLLEKIKRYDLKYQPMS